MVDVSRARGASFSSACAEESAVVAFGEASVVSIGEDSDGGAPRIFDTAFSSFLRIRPSYFALPDSCGFRSVFVAVRVFIVAMS